MTASVERESGNGQRGAYHMHVNYMDGLTAHRSRCAPEPICEKARERVAAHLRSTPVQIAHSMLLPAGSADGGVRCSAEEHCRRAERRALRRRTRNLRAHGSGQTEAGSADQASILLVHRVLERKAKRLLEGENGE